jgi:hypothetical protein
VFPPGGSFVRPAVSQKQLIPQRFAKAIQLPAHCRLAQKAAVGSSCNMAFFKQYGKVNEQIKVEFAYMRVAHDSDHINALIEFL